MLKYWLPNNLININYQLHLTLAVSWAWCPPITCYSSLILRDGIIVIKVIIIRILKVGISLLYIRSQHILH